MFPTATFAPLPRPGDILRAFALPVSDTGAASNWQRPGDEALWLSRSAQSIGIVASLIVAERGRPASIWIPDYFCNQPLTVVRNQGHAFVFYPVTERLEPDWTQCRDLLTTLPCDVFVLVHYFGVPTPAGKARRFADHAGAVLIEDAAHVLRPAPGIGETGDFVMYSPHKWLATPSGAVLIARPASAKHGVSLRAAAQPPHSFAASDLIWAARRLLQRTPLGQLARYLRPGGPRGFLDDPTGGKVTAGARTTRLAQDLIVRAPIAEIAATYRENFQALRAALPAGVPLQIFHVSQSTDVPYRLVVRANSEEFAARLYTALRRARLPVESWPDLPPEVSGAPDRHPAARALRRSVLMLPIHHTTRIGDAAATFRRVLDTL